MGEPPCSAQFLAGLPGSLERRGVVSAPQKVKEHLAVSLEKEKENFNTEYRLATGTHSPLNV